MSGELLCQLANVMILGTLVPRLPGPPPVSSGEEKKVKAPGKSPPKPTASSVAVPNLVLQPNTFEDYKRAVQVRAITFPCQTCLKRCKSNAFSQFFAFALWPCFPLHSFETVVKFHLIFTSRLLELPFSL